jgi:hypothetical protein
MGRKIIILSSIFIVLLFLNIFFISAVCTVVLDKISYNQGETASADMVCTGAEEKSDAYTLNWTYQNGTQLEADAGTTSGTAGEHFIESYTIASDHPEGVWLNATLQGPQQEGTDSANVTAPSATNLIFANSLVAGKFLGITSSLKSTITASGKAISGGYCKISIWSNDATQMLGSDETVMVNGEVKTVWTLGYDSFDEGVDYQAKAICYCGSDGSENECIDEDGATVEDAIGSAVVGFTTNTWMTINTDPMPIVYENNTDFPNAVVFAGFGERVFYGVNVTSYAGASVKLAVETFLTNNDTGAIFLQETKNAIVSIDPGNSSLVGRHEIASNVPTGTYYITKFYDVVYNNIIVSQGIITTETFNVTGTDDSFKLENVLTDKANYYTGEALHVCINLTNNFDKRIEFEVLYNFRCGEDNLNSALDRSLVAEHTEFRALSGGTTQNQCAELPIKYIDHLLYMTSQCYASVTIKSPYINTFDNKKSITSAVFNVTDYGMYPEYEIDPTYPIVRLFPDWRRFDDVVDGVPKNYVRAKVNITNLKESFLDPDGIITDDDWDVYVVFTDRMPSSQEIFNYTVQYKNGTKIDNPIENKCLQYKNGDRTSVCSLGIEEVNFSDTDDDYFEVFVWFEDYEERSTDALEDIANKTGTFHMEVDCPTQTKVGEIICNISARVEDSQLMEKEVDFTCYVLDVDSNQYGTVNWNQMITRTLYSTEKTFPFPNTITSGQKTLKCTADYYNLGSRTDTFSDTFTYYNTLGGSGGSVLADFIDKVKDIFKIKSGMNLIITPIFYKGDVVISKDLVSNVLDEEKYDRISFEINGENLGDNKITDITLLNANPKLLKDALNQKNFEILVDAKTILFESEKLLVSDIDDYGKEITFLIRLQGLDEKGNAITEEDAIKFILGEFPKDNFFSDFLLFFCIAIGVLFLMIIIYIINNKEDKN